MCGLLYECVLVSDLSRAVRSCHLALARPSAISYNLQTTITTRYNGRIYEYNDQLGGLHVGGPKRKITNGLHWWFEKKFNAQSRLDVCTVNGRRIRMRAENGQNTLFTRLGHGGGFNVCFLPNFEKVKIVFFLNYLGL